VARPALSASRSFEILDLLAASPGRRLTLSEIARATRINTASCHAVLSALCDRGYLARCPRRRTYGFGPALVAIGRSALAGQPLIERAEAAAETLNRELGLPVVLTALAGDDIVSIVSLPDPSGREPGLRVGERLPLIAPVGGAFVAWAPDADVEAWIARNPSADAECADDWRSSLVLTRRRGFYVGLRPPESPALAALMADMASPRRPIDGTDRARRLIEVMDHAALQPETLEPEALYEVSLIASPLFDQNGQAAFNLCLGNLPGRTSGATITAHADRLVRTCLQIMRQDRED
jgi:DNA-binding IclR family transcriptional regulator